MIDFSPALRTALINDATVGGLVGEWEDSPAVFTRTPVPADAPMPLVVISPDVSYIDLVALSDERPQVEKDIFVYGDQPDQYRVVESIARRVYDLFHRTRFSISVAGYNIVLISATGPRPAPVDDENMIGRVVTLTILAQRA